MSWRQEAVDRLDAMSGLYPSDATGIDRSPNPLWRNSSNGPYCANCYWWAALDGRKFLGLCGHHGRHTVTDRSETCDDHEEPKE